VSSDRLSFFPALAVALFTSSAAAAEPSRADVERANAEFEKGWNCYHEKVRDLPCALRGFSAADDLVKKPGTGYYVAKTLAELGRLREAEAKATSVTRLPVDASETDKAREARSDAAALASQMRERIPTIRIVVRGPAAGAGATVRLDGVAVAVDGSLPAASVDPGEHRVEVAATGFVTASEQLAIMERQHVVLQFSLAPVATPVRPVVQPFPIAPPARVEQRLVSTPGALIVSGFTLAAAGLGLGIGAGVHAVTLKQRLADACTDNVCLPASAGDLDSGKTLSHVSTAGFVMAGVGSAIGIAGIVLHVRKRGSSGGMAVTLEPAGVSLRAKF
jgi:hypothetical protein